MENTETKRVRDQISALTRSIQGLKAKLKQLSAIYNQISDKQRVIESLKANEKTKQDFRQGDIRQRIEFGPVDEIFDGLWAEDIGGMFLSVVNITMIGVIAVSAYLWFKLDKYEKGY